MRHGDTAATMWRLRALVRRGWPLDDLARRAGIRHATAEGLAAGRGDRVDARTHAAVEVAFEALWDTPGPSTAAEDHARAAGWPMPMDLDDDTGLPTSDAMHGSSAGYWRHRNHGERECDACRAAYNRSRRERYAARRPVALAPPGGVCGEKRGTPAGALLHYYAGERPCEACREAKNRYARTRRSRLRAAVSEVAS